MTDYYPNHCEKSDSMNAWNFLICFCWKKFFQILFQRKAFNKETKFCINCFQIEWINKQIFIDKYTQYLEKVKNWLLTFVWIYLFINSGENCSKNKYRQNKSKTINIYKLMKREKIKHFLTSQIFESNSVL